jgi:CBS-domain-containing membrane protein
VRPEEARPRAVAAPPGTIRSALLAGSGAGLAIALMGLLGEAGHVRLLIAPLGASAALIWALPNAPLAQPRAVVGGNLLSAVVGAGICELAGAAPWTIGLGVGLALAGMLLTRTLHAPACALPVFFALDPEAGTAQVALVLAGSCFLVAMGLAHHRLVTKVRWPDRWV